MWRDLLKAVLTACLIAVIYPSSGSCTVEYARETGKNCGYCHIDPTGGGRLTKDGEAFKDNLRIRGQYRTLNPVQRVIRFIIGYFHIMTAIIWFGAILYVHIILKPAYAAQGLPRDELMLGWGSIIIMAVTGTLLSVARVPTWHMLFHTRFGILLTIKIILFLIMVSTAVFVTFVVGPKLRKKREQGILHRTGDMTSEELSQYDGKEGRPGYIAYNGIIYDVTNSKLWREGSHFKKHHAGTDLTDILKTAPHGEEKVLKVAAIGKLLIEKEIKKPPHIRIYFRQTSKGGYNMAKRKLLIKAMIFAVCVCIWSIPGIAGAHCDTLDGPVVTTAKAALEKEDVTPVLKWVRKEDEKEIKELFNKTLAVRKQSKEAKELADMYFFETLVRIHRAGEGAPYTGLKKEPAEPIIAAADKALESGSTDNLVKLVTDAGAKGVRERFEHAKETKKHSDESVEAGRKFVEAYVEFTHYVERLYMDAMGPSGHSRVEEGKAEEHHHH